MNDSLLQRVAGRYVLARAVSLVPEFKAALLLYQTGGDPAPMKNLIRKVCEIIRPGGGQPPSWFFALGVAKRNALTTLYKEGTSIVGIIDPNIGVNGPDKWRDYIAGRLEAWGKGLRTLEIASEASNEEREIHHGGFTIMPMPGLKKAETDAALEALDEAASKIRSKFPEVLYGKVFFSTHLSVKTAAHYVFTDDTIHLSVRAKKRFSDIYTLVHEFGHRYDNKFLKPGVRKAFWDLSTRKEYEQVVYDNKLRSAVADEAVDVAKARKEGRDFNGISPALERWMKWNTDLKSSIAKYLSGSIDEAKLHAEVKGSEDRTITTNTVLHGPLAVTPYGATKPSENFAEAFAHYVLGMSMPQEFQEIFSTLA